MHKTLSLLLLAASAICVGQSAVANKAVTNNAVTYPRVVAKVSLTGQTAVIPTTTIFTPKASGLYRISVYGAMTKPVSENAANWDVSLGWTDDAGAEGAGLMEIEDWYAPPAAFGACVSPFLSTTEQSPAGCVLVARNVAGQPLTYSVGAYNSPGGTYELFITVEQLM
jgi:hypothetical protein